MLSLPPPASADPPGPDWADIEQRASRATMHLRTALSDLKALAEQYGRVNFGYAVRPSEMELRARHAWASTRLLRDSARARLSERERSRARSGALPAWQLRQDVQEMDTARLVPSWPTHPPPVYRAPHQTGRMRIVEDPHE